MSKLKQYRKAAGLTQEELARSTGIPQNLLSYYENGQRNPKANNLFRLARFLGCPPWEVTSTWDMDLPVQAAMVATLWDMLSEADKAELDIFLGRLAVDYGVSFGPKSVSGVTDTLSGNVL